MFFHPPVQCTPINSLALEKKVESAPASGMAAKRRGRGGFGSRSSLIALQSTGDRDTTVVVRSATLRYR